MAYAGICGSHNIQNNSDDYFHVRSLDQIVNYITTGTGSTCGEVTETENEPPTVTAFGDGLSIPTQTPFVLAGSATDDSELGALTYTWEEFDLGPAGPPAGATGWGFTAPFFRSFDPTPDSIRFFPSIEVVLDGGAPSDGEGLPIDAHTLTFRLTVRDNLGGIADEQVDINVVEGTGPFLVTFGNEEGAVFGTGVDVEVTWDVAGTDGEEIGAEFVDIIFSGDNGETFSDTLAAATPNDGAEVVTLPDLDTGEEATGRIMIRAVDHIFFDVNDEPFALNVGVANEARPMASHALSAVYPNPFGLSSTRATLNLAVDQAQAVRASVYDALGRRVAVLHDGHLAAGQNRQLVLDATTLAGGTYFVRVVGETFTDVRQVTVVR
jgi:hypothetical protein